MEYIRVDTSVREELREDRPSAGNKDPGRDAGLGIPFGYDDHRANLRILIDAERERRRTDPSGISKAPVELDTCFKRTKPQPPTHGRRRNCRAH